MKATFASLLLAASLALACTHSAPPAAATTTTCCAGMADGMKRMCPMAVPGTSASALDVDGGAALEFTTTSGEVADLRARVHHMADKHEHGGCPMMSEMKTASSAKVEETAAGARIVFTATNPAELAALRENVRAEAQHMRAGCPMPR